MNPKKRDHELTVNEWVNIMEGNGDYEDVQCSVLLDQPCELNREAAERIVVRILSAGWEHGRAGKHS